MEPRWHGDRHAEQARGYRGGKGHQEPEIPWQAGRVKRWDEGQTYGFITASGLSGDIFIHKSVLRNGDRLMKDEEVQFKARWEAVRGQWQATDVKRGATFLAPTTASSSSAGACVEDKGPYAVRKGRVKNASFITSDEGAPDCYMPRAAILPSPRPVVAGEEVLQSPSLLVAGEEVIYTAYWNEKEKNYTAICVSRPGGELPTSDLVIPDDWGWQNAQAENGTIAVCTFNLEAEVYYDYGQPGKYTCFKDRRPALLREIRKSGAAILMFQEVDFFEELAQDLPEYEGFFAPKTKRNPVMEKTEGQAVFVRTDQLIVKDAFCWTLFTSKNQEAMQKLFGEWQDCLRGKVRHIRPSDSRERHWPQVVLGLHLELGDPSNPQQLLVASMHLKSKDSRDARKEQLTYFLRAINAELENMDPSTIVICGADLNDEHDVYARIFVQYGYEAFSAAGSVDFILTRSRGRAGLTVEEILTHPMAGRFTPHQLQPRLYPSDHYPLAARLSLRART